jgi:hypothetical protein
VKNEVADITQELKSAQGELWKKAVQKDLYRAKALLEALQQ